MFLGGIPAFGDDTSLMLTSSAGDPLLNGKSLTYSGADSSFSASLSNTNQIEVSVQPNQKSRPAGRPVVSIEFALGWDAPLHPGTTYSGNLAPIYPYPDPDPYVNAPRLRVFVSSYTGQPTGAVQFQVKKLILDSNWSIAALWFTFDQQVDGAAGSLHGEFRFHADSTQPSMNLPPAARLLSRPRAVIGVPTQLTAEAADDGLPTDTPPSVHWTIQGGTITGEDTLTPTITLSDSASLSLTVSDGEKSQYYYYQISGLPPYEQNLLHVKGPLANGGIRELVANGNLVDFSEDAYFGRVSVTATYPDGTEYGEYWIIECEADFEIPLHTGSYTDGSVSELYLTAPPAWAQTAAHGAKFEVRRIDNPSSPERAPLWFTFARFTDADHPAFIGEVRTLVPPADVVGAAPIVCAGLSREFTRLNHPRLHGAALAIAGASAEPLQTLWSVVSAAGTVTFTDATAEETDVQFSAEGDYVLRLTATQGLQVISDEVTITVTHRETSLTLRDFNLNDPDATFAFPPADDMTLVQDSPQYVSFETANWRVAFTTDADGTLPPGNYTIPEDYGRGPRVMEVSRKPEGGYPAKGDFTVREWTIDSKGNVLSAWIVFDCYPGNSNFQYQPERRVGELRYRANVTTAESANLAPVVTAGPSQILGRQLHAALHATFEDDLLPRGQGLARQWSVVRGPGKVTFDEAHAHDTTAHISHPGAYQLRFSVSDGELTGSDDVTVVAGSAASQTFHGLVRRSGNIVGSFNVTATPFGAFTLTLRLGVAKPIVFTGHLSDGSWSREFQNRAGGTTDIDLSESADQRDLYGTLSANGYELTFGATEAASPFLRATRQTSPFAGRYTWSAGPASSTPTGPIGFGSGTMIVGATGSYRWVGILGDGSTVAHGGVLAMDDTFAIERTTKDGRAYGGTLLFKAPADGRKLDFAGSLGWARFSDDPDIETFSQSEYVIGARYRPPAKGQNMLTGDAQTLALATNFFEPAGSNIGSFSGSLDPLNRFKSSNSALTIRPNPQTGLFMGTWEEPAGTVHHFSGAFIQSLQQGYGCYVQDRQSYAVELEPDTQP